MIFKKNEMPFQPITEKLVRYVKKGEEIRTEIRQHLEYGSMNPNAVHTDYKLQKSIQDWMTGVLYFLEQNEQEMWAAKMKNEIEDYWAHELDPIALPRALQNLKKATSILIEAWDRLETKKGKKDLRIIQIDDIDNFKPFLANVDITDVDNKYFNSAFLEDDVENAFLEILNEPYKENDSGAETRDLYTNKIRINGRRVQAVIMFKGRGVKIPLTIADCGKNGDQLIKLAKNTTAQLYIVQHVNKIQPEVIEALKDHLMSYSYLNELFICTVDGTDTVRVLKGLNRDLDALSEKTGHSKTAQNK